MKKQRLKGYTVKTVLKYNLFALKDPRAIERFAQGLQKAGMPDKQENEGTVVY
jgi:hypothetical protein